MAAHGPRSHAGRERTGILFVCMGNICRSPLAEGVFIHQATQRGVVDHFDIDSAGTGGWHAGERPDPRAIDVALRHGITLDSRARQVRGDDFKRFDLLLCMDEDNREHLEELGAPQSKLKLLLEFDPKAPVREVPDPYYGGVDGFMTVYQLVNGACAALLDSLLARTK
jgi:protein-tyrosine phosphatase